MSQSDQPYGEYQLNPSSNARPAVPSTTGSAQPSNEVHTRPSDANSVAAPVMNQPSAGYSMVPGTPGALPTHMSGPPSAVRVVDATATAALVVAVLGVLTYAAARMMQNLVPLMSSSSSSVSYVNTQWADMALLILGVAMLVAGVIALAVGVTALRSITPESGRIGRGRAGVATGIAVALIVIVIAAVVGAIFGLASSSGRGSFVDYFGWYL